MCGSVWVQECVSASWRERGADRVEMSVGVGAVTIKNHKNKYTTNKQKPKITS